MEITFTLTDREAWALIEGIPAVMKEAEGFTKSVSRAWTRGFYADKLAMLEALQARLMAQMDEASSK